MITLNAAHLFASKPRSSVARIKWPVEDTGMNSVTPSTMPRMIAIRKIGIGFDESSARSWRSNEFGARQSGCLGTDRGKRGRFDPECLEPWSATAWDIIALQHQPLVARKRRAGKKPEIGQG